MASSTNRKSMHNHWPEGEKMAVVCPSCNSTVNVQISVVRELGDPLRPADCYQCNAEFDLLADGTTEFVSVPPLETSARGHELKKQFQNLVFDPNE